MCLLVRMYGPERLGKQYASKHLDGLPEKFQYFVQEVFRDLFWIILFIYAASHSGMYLLC